MEIGELDADVDIYTSRKIKHFQFIDGVSSGLNDVYEAFVSPNFKLIHGLFVHMDRTIDAELFNPGGNWNWTRDPRTGSFGRFHDVLGGLIDGSVVKAFELDTYALIGHSSGSS